MNLETADPGSNTKILRKKIRYFCQPLQAKRPNRTSQPVGQSSIIPETHLATPTTAFGNEKDRFLDERVTLKGANDGRSGRGYSGDWREVIEN